MLTSDQFTNAHSSRLLLDSILLVVLTVLVLLMPIRNIIKMIFIIFFTWVFFINNLQTVDVSKLSDSEVIVYRTSNILSICQGLIPKTVNAVVLSFTGTLQLAHWAAKDHTYEITKTVCLGHLMEFCPEMRFRIQGLPIYPKKFFMVTQHGPTLMDLFNFLTFIPKGFKVRVVHDLAGGVIIKNVLERLLLNPLYGAVIMDRSDKNRMKTTLQKLVCDIKKPGPMVVVLWPSGKAWDSFLPNGIGEFKSGLFLLPLYTQLPVCVVHSRTNVKKDKCIVTRGEFIVPPTTDINTSYMDFVNQGKEYPLKDLLVKFTNQTESIYRRMDNEIIKELEIG